MIDFEEVSWLKRSALLKSISANSTKKYHVHKKELVRDEHATSIAAPLNALKKPYVGYRILYIFNFNNTILCLWDTENLR